MRIGRAERVFGANAEFSLGTFDPPGVHGQRLVPSGERLIELERTILDQLGVEPAVGGKIDVFKEYAEHLR